MSILSNISELCDNQHITIYKLEKLTGISQGTIKKWDNASPTCKAIELVANYFDVSVDYLLGRTENMISHKEVMLCSKSSVEIFRELEKYNLSDLQIAALRRIICSILTDFK